MNYPPGARLGAYEIVAPLGAGGMGEVYRARDSRLNRDVALKVLPERLAGDAAYLARFQREAQVLAALNHPNIAAIYGLEDRAIVMELVEGETLGERTEHGPIPLDEALHIARQIADALEAAHEKGIVHRDLKPANVKITPAGVAKVLDFGLAKSDPVVNTTSHDSPTLTLGATHAGLILGTAAYMSPEQARGKPVDKRADIWAFGVILYEAVTGTRLFDGETVSDSLAAVLRHQPDWTRVPAELRRLLQSCLEKEPRQRLRDIGDAWRLLEKPPAGKPAAPPPTRLTRAPWIVAALALLPALLLAWIHFRETPPAPPPLVRFQFSAPDRVIPGGTFALSPNGRRLAFQAYGPDPVRRVWLHDMAALDSRPLPGSEIPYGTPVSWSPDGRFLAVQIGPKLQRFDIAGGFATTLANVRIVVGSSWNRQGTLLLGSGGEGPLQSMSSADKSIAPLTRLDPQQGFTGDLMPWFLPDGTHFLYLRHSSIPEKKGIYIGSLDVDPARQDTHLLAATTVGAIYVPKAGADPQQGFILFQRDFTLLAQPFDARRLNLSGDPIPIAEDVGSRLDSGFFTATPDVLVYRAGAASRSQLTWLSTDGKTQSVVGEPGDYATGIGAVSISPDGSRAAVGRRDAGRRDLWIVDFDTGTTQRLTFAGNESGAVWSPDGTRLVFRSGRSGKPGLYRMPVDGSGPEELLLASDRQPQPNSWSRDGRFLLYDIHDPKNGMDMWLLPLDDRKARPLLATEYDERGGVFSPDGRWIAYLSNESGRVEVYVTAFSPDGAAQGKWIVSRGALPWPLHWRSDSRELNYVGADSSLVSVAISPAAQFQAGPPTPYGKVPPGAYGAIAPGARRVLAEVPVSQEAPSPFTVVLNWQRALAPRRR